jgi:hypothetical protein
MLVKNSKYEILHRPQSFWWELRFCVRSDGWTDGYDEANRLFFSAVFPTRLKMKQLHSKLQLQMRPPPDMRLTRFTSKTK